MNTWLNMATTSFTKKTLGLDTIEPAVTPPPVTGNTSFIKKPKLASNKPKKREIPEGLWTKCKRCGTMVFDKELDENLKVCPHCQHHFPIGSRERIHSLVQTCTFEEMDAQMTSVNVLTFTGASSTPPNWKNTSTTPGSRMPCLPAYASWATTASPWG